MENSWNQSNHGKGDSLYGNVFLQLGFEFLTILHGCREFYVSEYSERVRFWRSCHCFWAVSRAVMV